MKKIKQLLSLCLALLMVATLIPLGAAADTAEGILAAPGADQLTELQEALLRTNLILSGGAEGQQDSYINPDDDWSARYVDHITAQNFLTSNLSFSAIQFLSKDGSHMTAHVRQEKLLEILGDKGLDALAELEAIVIQLYPMQHSYEKTIYTHYTFLPKALLEAAVKYDNTVYVNSPLFTLGLNPAAMTSLLDTKAAGFLLETIPGSTETKRYAPLGRTQEDIDYVSFCLYPLSEKGYPQLPSDWEAQKKAVATWSMTSSDVLPGGEAALYNLRLGSQRLSKYSMMVDLDKNEENPTSSKPLLAEGVTAMVEFQPDHTRKLAIVGLDDVKDLNSLAARLGLTLDGKLGQDGLDETADMLAALKFLESSSKGDWVTGKAKDWDTFDQKGLVKVLMDLDLEQKEAEAIVEAAADTWPEEFPAGKEVTDTGYFAALLIALDIRLDDSGFLPNLNAEAAQDALPSYLFSRPKVEEPGPGGPGGPGTPGTSGTPDTPVVPDYPEYDIPLPPGPDLG